MPSTAAIASTSVVVPSPPITASSSLVGPSSAAAASSSVVMPSPLTAASSSVVVSSPPDVAPSSAVVPSDPTIASPSVDTDSSEFQAVATFLQSLRPSLAHRVDAFRRAGIVNETYLSVLLTLEAQESRRLLKDLIGLSDIEVAIVRSEISRRFSTSL